MTSLKKIESWLRLVFTPIVVLSIRLLERVFPRRLLSWIFWPAAVLWSVLELPRQLEAARAWRECSASCRPDHFRFVRQQTAAWTHSRFVNFWGERLREPGWIERCRVESKVNLGELRHSPRPMILTSLHYGPFETLPLWLRAHDIMATALVGRRVHPLRARFHAMVAPGKIPLTWAVEDIGEVRKLLVPGIRLLAWMDVNRGKQIDVPCDDLSLRIASGPIRMAALADADLIPCLIAEEGMWHYVIYFGAPVPREYLGRTPNVAAAAEHLARESLEFVLRDTAQSGFRLLSRLSARHEAAPRPVFHREPVQSSTP